MSKNATKYYNYKLRSGKTIQLTQEEENKFGKTGYKRLMRGAGKRGVPFEIEEPMDLLEFWLTVPDTCNWCRRHIRVITRLYNRVNNIGKRANLYIRKIQNVFSNNFSGFLTYDRANPGKGYSIDNIVKCCLICNSAKGLLVEPKDMQQVSRSIFDRIYKELKTHEK